ncbi:hypothetical protein EsH8_VII_000020 [Colletotrichum jinshuiense]
MSPLQTHSFNGASCEANGLFYDVWLYNGLMALKLIPHAAKHHNLTLSYAPTASAAVLICTSYLIVLSTAHGEFVQITEWLQKVGMSTRPRHDLTMELEDAWLEFGSDSGSDYQSEIFGTESATSSVFNYKYKTCRRLHEHVYHTGGYPTTAPYRERLHLTQLSMLTKLKDL